MKITKFVTLASVVMAAMSLTCEVAEGQEKQPSKKDLIKENELLKLRVESLQLEVEKFKNELHIADSLAKLSLKSEELIEEEGAGVAAAEITFSQEESDSLLNIWFTHTSLVEDMKSEDKDATLFKSNVPDSVYVKRIDRMNSIITLPYNEIVREQIIRYSQRRNSMPKILALCEYYMPIFEEIFNKYGIPEELTIMAIIESAMNPRAVSPAGATGMWQFIYSTGKKYGLHIDTFVDERMDPIKSADAAARYLRDAYKTFGDWNLAIASYNCGPGNIYKAIKRSGSRKFWDLWPYLPEETRGYLPAFVGALYAVNYHEEHGIKPAALAMPTQTDTFHIKKKVHLKQVSELTGAPLDVLKNLNPQYKHEIIPGNEREYVLRIPFNYTDKFIAHEDSLHTYKDEAYFNPVTIKKITELEKKIPVSKPKPKKITYVVKAGDCLGVIAEKYNCSIENIQKWNNLKDTNIRIGQSLILYEGNKGPSTSSSSKSSKSSKSKKSSSGYVVYTVQSGDSFYSIAKDYPGISAQNIMDYNNIKDTNIRPGTKIKIPLKM